MADSKVRLVHPDTGGQFDCDPVAVAAWQALGWKRPGVTTATKTKKESSNG